MSNSKDIKFAAGPSEVVIQCIPIRMGSRTVPLIPTEVYLTNTPKSITRIVFLAPLLGVILALIGILLAIFLPSSPLSTPCLVIGGIVITLTPSRIFQVLRASDRN